MTSTTATTNESQTPRGKTIADFPLHTQRRGSLSRIIGLARAELLALWRNKVAAFYAIFMAPAMVYLIATIDEFSGMAEAVGASASIMAISVLVVFGICMAIYFNLTTAAVARRESMVLKRLSTGSARPWEILVAVATPNMAVFLLQTIAVTAVIASTMQMPAFTNVIVTLVAVMLGATVFVLLAYITSAYTKSVESAQLTTMPMMLVAFAVSGVILPMSFLPDALGTIAQRLPVYPVADAIAIGLGGESLDGEAVDFTGAFGAAAEPLLILAAWVVVGAIAVKAVMRFEPRR